MASRIAHPGKNQLLCHANTRAAPWRGPCGELRPPANSQHWYTDYASKSSSTVRLLGEHSPSLQMTTATQTRVTAVQPNPALRIWEPNKWLCHYTACKWFVWTIRWQRHHTPSSNFSDYHRLPPFHLFPTWLLNTFFCLLYSQKQYHSSSWPHPSNSAFFMLNNVVLPALIPFGRYSYPFS